MIQKHKNKLIFSKKKLIFLETGVAPRFQTVSKSLFGLAFAAAFLFNSCNISFGYKTSRNFHAWAPPLSAFKTQFC